jgi:putative ABC transport system permease protein
VDEFLGAQELSAHAGDTVALGDASFRLDAIVTEEPEAALDVFGAGPKVFMNLADLPATALEQPGSRVGYRLAVAGEPDAVERFEERVRANLGRGQRLETAADARPEIRDALERASRFLGLAALVSVVLAAIAVAMAARRHAARHLSGSAVMRCLGASQSTLVGIHVGELLLLGLFASGVGVLLAFGLQALVGQWLAQALKVAIPGVGAGPALAGIGVGLTVLLAFGLPPVLALRRVPALRVLRRDLDATEPSSWAVAVTWPCRAGAAAALAGGLREPRPVHAGRHRHHLARARPARDGADLAAAAPASPPARSVALRFGLGEPTARSERRADRIAGARADGVAAAHLRAQRPVVALAGGLAGGCPNRFVINAQPEQLPQLRAQLQRMDIAAPEFYPIVRGRLVRYNGRAVTWRGLRAGRRTRAPAGGARVQPELRRETAARQ